MPDTSIDSSTSSRTILGDYLTPEQLGAELGVAVITLATWRMQQKGPAYTTVARKIKYRRDAVREWLAGQERKPGPLPRRK